MHHINEKKVTGRDTRIQEISNDVSRAANETTISTLSATGEEIEVIMAGRL